MSEKLNMDQQKYVDLVVLFKNEFDAKYPSINDLNYITLLYADSIVEKIEFLKSAIKSIERGKYGFDSNITRTEVIMRYKARIQQLNEFRIRTCN